MRMLRCSASPSARSRSARGRGAEVPAAGAPIARRGVTRTRSRSSGGTVPAPFARAPTAAASMWAGTTTGWPVASAASKSSSPSSAVSGGKPSRAIRVSAASEIRLLMPPSSAHSPHTMLVAGSPMACRWWARASRKVFAAA
nr:hypothetical protein [Actinomadura sp. WMMB 499]